MRIAPLVLALAGCGSNPGPTGGSPSDSGPQGGTPTATATGAPTEPGEVGHLVYWAEDRGGIQRSQQLLGVFGPTFGTLPAPALCAALGHLCVDQLPTEDGAWVDATPSSFDPFANPSSWVGNTIDVGGHQLLFLVDQETGFGYYTKEIAGSGLDALDVRLAGEWGEWTAPQVVPVGDYIEGLVPTAGSFALVNGGIDLSWTPGTGAGVVYVRITHDALDRLWRFPDLGNASIPEAEVGPLPDGEQATLLLYRVDRTASFDANGHTLTAESWSVAHLLTARSTFPSSCKAVRDADPTAQSGVHTIQPNPMLDPVEVYCDMDVDGGGWTLVSSTTDPVDDIATAWTDNLTTIDPTAAMDGVWNGMRFPITGQSDIRFACKIDRTSPLMDVDLSFYAVAWYREITSGSDDIDSCFLPGNVPPGAPPPARRNNLSGEVLAAGDPWDAGRLVGEEECQSTDDFTVDFDDRGHNGDEADGTDWGEDDGAHKCGTIRDVTTGAGGWYIFVRE